MKDTIYYSQEGQDSIILQFFKAKGIENGKYLDVGALDGLRFSNTALLEQSGWTGICVEMHPSYFDMLTENRPNSVCYSCGAADKDKVKEVVSLNWRASLSTTDFGLENFYRNSGYAPYYGDRAVKEINGFLNGHHEVELRTINSILDENQQEFSKLNLVSIDIDGSEARALPHCDLNKCSPELLSLEYTIMGKEYVTEYAKQFDFFPSRIIGADILFVKTEEDDKLLQGLSKIGNKYHNRHPATTV